MNGTRETARKQPDATRNGLPASPDVERLILGSVVNGSVDFEEVRREMVVSDFSRQQNRDIYTCMNVLYERGTRIDRTLLAEELGRRRQLAGVGGFSYLASLDEGIPRLPNVKGYIDVVRKKAAFRQLILKGDRLVAQGLEQVEDPDAIAAATIESLRELLHQNGQPADAPPSVPQWPGRIQEEGFHGVAGEAVRKLEPHTEADEAALLIQLLTAWGNLATRGPYVLAENNKHHSNLFCVLVGVTSKGRKGTSWGRIRGIVESVDDNWVKNCLISGIGSGEALIDALNKEDHRRLVIESELARLLAIMNREGTTISSIFRTCWDSGEAHVIVRMKEAHVTDGHLSLIGHVTRDELKRCLSDVEIANGFGNRILWVCTKRSKELPFGGGSIDFGDIPSQLREATQFTRRIGNTRIDFDSEAHDLWPIVYHDLSQGKPGLFGAATGRGEPQVLRLALVYALLDRSEKIRIEHLRAGLAIWRYCEASALYIWGDALGDPTADEILRVLRAAGQAGMTRWEITNHFGRNKTASELERACRVLTELGLVRFDTESTGGRSSTRYWAL